MMDFMDVVTELRDLCGDELYMEVTLNEYGMKAQVFHGRRYVWGTACPLHEALEELSSGLSAVGEYGEQELGWEVRRSWMG